MGRNRSRLQKHTQRRVLFRKKQPTQSLTWNRLSVRKRPYEWEVLPLKLHGLDAKSSLTCGGRVLGRSGGKARRPGEGGRGRRGRLPERRAESIQAPHFRVYISFSSEAQICCQWFILFILSTLLGVCALGEGRGAFCGGSVVRNNLPAIQETPVRSLGREDPLERKWRLTPVFLPGESHGRRSLEGYSPRGHEELDTTEQLNTHARLVGDLTGGRVDKHLPASAGDAGSTSGPGRFHMRWSD